MTYARKITRRNFLAKTAQAGIAVTAAGPALAMSACIGPREVPAVNHRHIIQARCIGCGQCLSFCPMSAITLEKKSWINPEECVECGVCWRSRVCPVDAIRPGLLQWPRTLREQYSNPMGEHKSTGVAGRGTEETKTNDSQHRYRKGSVGVLVELGRPVLGARFSDVERVVKKFKARGYELVQDNPVVDLIADPKTGILKPDVLHEKIISCVVEFLMPESDAGRLLPIVRELEQEVQTIFNISVALRADEDGRSSFNRLFGAGTFHLPWAKVNIGIAQGIKAKGV
jgi:ferredoxin